MPRIRLALAAACAVLLAGPASADTYPSRAVKLIAPGPPGSPADIRARWTGDALSRAFGQPVVVENKSGAGGNIGAEAVARSAPDGYTLLLVHHGILAVNPHLYARTGFDALNDFMPVTRLVDSYLMLAVPAGSPAGSVADLVRMAKERPGQLSFGSSGIGTPPHMAGELFKRIAAVDVVHVPYKGATPALMDLIAGRLAFTIDGMASSGPQARAGKIKPLAVTSAKRLAAFPQIPTLAEAGVAGYEFSAWMGVMAPAGTPAEVVARLNQALAKALSTAEARDWFEAQGGVPVGDSPEAFGAHIRSEHAKWGALIRELGIRAE